MKIKEYLKEVSLTFLGVLIALIIDNYREDVRDRRIVNSYLDIVSEDLNFDIQSLTEQLKRDSAWAKRVKTLRDIFATNSDLPELKYGLASWSTGDVAPYRKLSGWDSLDYYTLRLYEDTEYKTRKIGFSTIVNSGLSHQIDQKLLQKITMYYTTESDYMDFVVGIDKTCMWNAIPFLNKHQGSFKDVVMRDDFNMTLLRNEATGRYNTRLNEMRVKVAMIERAKELLGEIEEYN
jgi:hypothetical protein